MSTYEVKKFKAKKAGSVDTELAEFLNGLAADGWGVVSVVTGLDVKGAGLVGNRPDSFLVIVSKPAG